MDASAYMKSSSAKAKKMSEKRKTNLAISGAVVLFFLAAFLLMRVSFPRIALATGPVNIATQTPLGPYPGTVGSGALNFTLAAADPSNGNSFALTGREVLLVFNSDVAAAHTVTFTSAPDPQGRTSDITSYSVASGAYAIFSYRGGVNGWRQSDGTAHLMASSASIEFAPLYIQ